MKFVEPKVFHVGNTVIDRDGMFAYLAYTDQEDFLESLEAAEDSGLSTAEALCTFYAKLCYKSLVLGKNQNISRIRELRDNFFNIVEVKHGAIFEHCQLNFVITDCSRVLTHELVRHRAGMAYSQTSGRYVALDDIRFVFDPVLEPVRHIVESVVSRIEEAVQEMRDSLIKPGMSFREKKKITSAIRRIAPNGQANEIGFSCNLRALRHIIEMRTSGSAEREIRSAFNQVADIVERKYPHILYGSTKTMVEGLWEYTGLHV